jgi:two-component system, NtrC family, sensor kinase
MRNRKPNFNVIRFAITAFLLILSLSNIYCQNNTLDSLLKVLSSQNEDSNKVKILNRVSILYFQKNNYDIENPLHFANEALKLSDKINFKKGRGFALKNIGSLYLQKENYPEGLKNLLEALKIFEELGLKGGKAEISQYLGGIYLVIQNDSLALKYLNEALKIRQELGDKSGVAQTLNSIAEWYLEYGNSFTALKNTLMALKIIKEPGFIGEDWSLAFTYSVLGRIYEKQGDSAVVSKNKLLAVNKYNEAVTNYLASLKEWEIIGGRFTEQQKMNLGNIYRKQKKYAKARQYLEGSLRQFKINGEIPLLDFGYLSLAQLDSAEGRYQQAFKHYKMHIIYQDSLFNEKNTKKLAETQMQYEFEKKEAISKLEQKKKDSEQKRVRNLLYFGLASILLVALFLYYNNRQKQKTNAILEEQKQTVESTLTTLKSTQDQLIQKEKLASLGELTAGIAHEIQNPLNFVNNFSELSVDLAKDLKEEIHKPNIDKDYVEELLTDLSQNQEKINHHGKRASSIVKGMLEHSRASTGVKEMTDINALADEYFRLSYHGLRAKDKDFNATMETDFDKNLPKINLIPQDMGRVLLNLFNNAFYAVTEKSKLNTEGVSFKPTVYLSTQLIDNQIVIKVKDNGLGMPESVRAKVFQPFFTTKPTGSGTGLGLSLAYDIVTKGHGWALEVVSTEGVGSEFMITLLMH